MGSFFIDLLSFDHEVAVYEKDAKRLRFTYNCYRFTKMEEIEMFRPELVINAVTVKYTLPAFEEVLPHLSQGIEKSWAMKREMLSPAYTTRYSDLPVAK